MKQALLILDDEVRIVTSLEHLFEDDYEVFTATRAEAAMRLAEEHNLAVLLCDERMPEVSGHEFLRRVKAVSKATRVMISGYADLTAVTEAVNGGQIFAYISKPWEPLALKATVSAAVGQFKLIEEIDRERELLRALMENIPDPIYFKDCQSRFTRVNQAHARSLGVKDSGECIGKSDADYFASADAQRWRMEENVILMSGRPQIDRIEQLERPQGGLWWASTTKVPMFDRSGQVSGIAGISRDISALKSIEEMLRERSEHHRLIIETANDAFIGMDQDGAITGWNPRAELTFGWTAAEVMGRPWWDTVVAPKYRELHARGVQEFLAASIAMNREFEMAGLHRDGHEFPVEATIWPIRVDGACSFNAFLRDISERRRTEEDLRRAKAAAESANRAKSEFLTTVSHEMRTPMNAILGMADLLAETALVEKQRGYVHIFQKAGANLLNLINNILDLSKAESGRFELESIGFELRPLLEKIIEMMLPRARDRGLKLTLEVLPGVPSGLVGDSHRLRQILLNLVGNALKFTERGSVTLRVEPDSGGKAGWLRFDVVDTGIGIAAHKTKMIFDPFTQADSSTTRKYGGTGLGLAISSRLVELMGGRIICTSELGKGSVFSLSAPFKETEAAEAVEPAAMANSPGLAGSPVSAVSPVSPLSGPAVRILIAEDCEDNLLLTEAYLSEGGFELDVAENGKVAVEKTISGNPDLVLMDLQMPVMDGLEATRAIRQWEVKTHAHPIPILALTAHAAEEEAGRSLEAGCTEHLTKPIKKATLLEAISRHLKNGKIHLAVLEGAR